MKKQTETSDPSKFKRGIKRPQRSFDLGFGSNLKEGEGAPKTEIKKRIKKSVLLKVDPEVHELLVDLVYTRRIGGHVSSGQGAVVAEALREYAKNHPPKRMPANIREEYSFPGNRKKG